MNEALGSRLNETPSMFRQPADGLTGNAEGLAITRSLRDCDNSICGLTSWTWSFLFSPKCPHHNKHLNHHKYSRSSVSAHIQDFDDQLCADAYRNKYTSHPVETLQTCASFCALFQQTSDWHLIFLETSGSNLNSYNLKYSCVSLNNTWSYSIKLKTMGHWWIPSLPGDTILYLCNLTPWLNDRETERVWKDLREYLSLLYLVICCIYDELPLHICLCTFGLGLEVNCSVFETAVFLHLCFP